VAYTCGSELNALKREVRHQGNCRGNRESWRVAKLSKSDKVSVYKDRSFEEIDVLAEIVEEPHSLCLLSTLSAVINSLSNAALGYFPHV
jgi:hypothetical protein